MSLFDTMSIYHIPETDDSRSLNLFFGFFKVIVMMCPPAFLGLFTVLQKWEQKKEIEHEEEKVEKEGERPEEEEEEEGQQQQQS